jgi:hypothetical protein
MSFVDLVLFILIGVGITNIVVNASILNKFRGFIKRKSKFMSTMTECMLCTGFWIGLLLSIIYPSISFIAGGAIISLISNLFGNIIEYINVSSEIKRAQIEYIDVEEE